MNTIKRLGLAVAAGAVLGFIVLSAPAHATGSKLEHSAEVTGDCGEITLTFVNNHAHATKDHTYVWNIRTSDGQDYDVEVPYSQSPVVEVVSLEPVEGGGVGWVSFGVVAGPESDYYLVNKTKTFDLCELEPTPTPTATVSPTPEPTPTATSEPTSEPTPTPTATSTSTDTPPPVGGSGGGDEKPGLPLTGSSLPLLTGAGVSLLGLGGGLLLLARRKRLPGTLEATPVE